MRNPRKLCLLSLLVQNAAQLLVAMIRMKLFVAALAATVANGAKFVSSRTSNAGDFKILEKQKCKGEPYTKHEDKYCDGWTGITLEECRAKCANGEVAPNCPAETCKAASFFPGSMKCHLFNECHELEDDFGATGIVKTDVLKKIEETPKKEPKQRPTGPVAELAIALPIVLVNLSNFSGQITNHRPLSHHYVFGNISADLEMLYDKAAGFYSVLHESMAGTDGLRFCPTRSEGNIMECIRLATCVVERNAGNGPKQIPMATYALIEELVTRFETITWPLLKDALVKEEGQLDLIKEDKAIPATYKCVASEEITSDEVSVPVGSFLQSEHAMSNALASATRGTHKVLDSHSENSSFKLTQHRLAELWHPICKELSCDPTSYIDIYPVSHKHTLKLMQTASASHVGSHIRQRIHLYIKLQHFIADYDREGDFDFMRPEGIQDSSEEIFSSYGQTGRSSLLSFTQSFDFDSGDRLFDRDAEEGEADTKSSRRRRRRRARRRRARRQEKRQARKAKREERRMMAKRIFGCLGKASFWNAEGYSKSFGSYVGFSFGQAAGGSNNALNDLVQGRAPRFTSAYYSFYASVGVGAVYEWFWGGLSITGAFTVTQSSALVGIYIGASACGWTAVGSTTRRCPFGKHLGPFKCSRATGFTISLFCCGIDLVSGENSCR